VFDVIILGSDVVYWLLNHVDGLKSRRDAKKFASRILKAGHIHDVVKKFSFSEKCYYVFEKSIYEGLLNLLKLFLIYLVTSPLTRECVID